MLLRFCAVAALDEPVANPLNFVFYVEQLHTDFTACDWGVVWVTAHLAPSACVQ